MTSSRGRTRGLAAAALLLACLGLLGVRVVVSSRALYRAGLQALSEGKADEGAQALGRAARMYAPGSPYAARALAELMTLGQRAEERGEPLVALRCFREARSAILATRSLYTPSPGLLAQANERIAVLMVAQEAADPALASEPAAARLQWHRQALARSDAPRAGFALLAILGTALLIGAAAGMILRGVDASGRLLRPAGRWALLLVLGLLLMALGLWRA